MHDPQICTTYTWKRYERFTLKKDPWGHSEVIPGVIIETKDGNSIKPKENPSGKDYGNTPELELVSESNAWLHPLNIQKALEYARDLFLAEDRIGVENLLYAYERALALPMPINEYSPWDDSSIAYWTAAKSEVASMLQRLRGHLDYFGNPAGYTPFLSLQGTIKLYAEETKRALRMLLLVGWIDAKGRNAKDVAEALGKAIDGLNEDTLQAATQVTSSEAEISDVINRMDALEKELKGMSNQLEILEQDQAESLSATTLVGSGDQCILFTTIPD